MILIVALAISNAKGPFTYYDINFWSVSNPPSVITFTEVGFDTIISSVR